MLLWWINSRRIAAGCKITATPQSRQQLQPRCRHFCFRNFLTVVSRFSPPTQAADVSLWRTSLHSKSLCSQQHSSKQENQWLSAEHGNIYDFGDWICVAYCWPAAAKIINILQRSRRLLSASQSVTLARCRFCVESFYFQIRVKQNHLSTLQRRDRKWAGHRFHRNSVINLMVCL